MEEFLSENDELLIFERQKWQEGYINIAGVDEVGRGPLAGSVVVAAAIFPQGSKIPRVNDSKRLTAKQRLDLRKRILDIPGFRYAIEEISPSEIDRINILQATHKAIRNVLNSLSETDFALIDGLPVPGLSVPNMAIVKGDSKSASIAAASILAKIYRDSLMTAYALEFPEYGFDRNKGYGTAEHMEALKKYGHCPIHRKSFAPVRDVINPYLLGDNQ